MKFLLAALLGYLIIMAPDFATTILVYGIIGWIFIMILKFFKSTTK